MVSRLDARHNIANRNDNLTRQQTATTDTTYNYKKGSGSRHETSESRSTRRNAIQQKKAHNVYTHPPYIDSDSRNLCRNNLIQENHANTQHSKRHYYDWQCSLRGSFLDITIRRQPQHPRTPISVPRFPAPISTPPPNLNIHSDTKVPSQYWPSCRLTFPQRL